LKQYRYPPDKQEKAIKTVLEQAEELYGSGWRRRKVMKRHIFFGLFILIGVSIFAQVDVLQDYILITISIVLKRNR